MIKLMNMLRWDVDLQARHYIYAANIFSTGSICAFIALLPIESLPISVATFFIFTDPALIGLAFIGALILMEKATGVIAALGVTPSPPWVYVLSKTMTMSLNGFLAGMAVAWVAHKGEFDIPLMTLALLFSNVLAVLIGFACVARAPSMNALMVTLIYVTTLLFLPLLAHFEIVSGPVRWLFAIIPSYAMLLSFDGAADPSLLSMGEWVYAYGYQSLWIVVGWFWTMREFRASIVSDGR